MKLRVLTSSSVKRHVYTCVIEPLIDLTQREPAFHHRLVSFHHIMRTVFLSLPSPVTPHPSPLTSHPSDPSPLTSRPSVLLNLLAIAFIGEADGMVAWLVLTDEAKQKPAAIVNWIVETGSQEQKGNAKQ